MRYRRQFVSVDVEVDIDEVLDELSDAELIEALRRRGIEDKSLRAMLLDVHDALMRRQPNEALVVLERALRPERDAARDYEAAKAGQHPFLVVGSA